MKIHSPTGCRPLFFRTVTLKIWSHQFDFHHLRVGVCIALPGAAGQHSSAQGSREAAPSPGTIGKNDMKPMESHGMVDDGSTSNSDTIWLFNIAMENPSWMEVLMGKSSINGPFSIAMLNNNRVCQKLLFFPQIFVMWVIGGREWLVASPIANGVKKLATASQVNLWDWDTLFWDTWNFDFTSWWFIHFYTVYTCQIPVIKSWHMLAPVSQYATSMAGCLRWGSVPLWGPPNKWCHLG